MAREFGRNMFIMLLAIMIGAIIITYFVADIINRSKIETLTTKHTEEIETIEVRNINFTNHFIQSSVLLDTAREDRSYGDYHFDLARVFYAGGVYQKVIDNCTSAMENYLNSKDNFEISSGYFNETKSYTSYDKYLEILDLYVGLTKSGAKLSMLRYNASKYLKYLAENLSVGVEPVNISELLELFNETMEQYTQELVIYNGYKEAIDEYQFFVEIREL